MVDTHRRHLQRPGQRTGYAGADQQGTDQPRTGGKGHPVDVRDLHAGLGQGLPDQRQQLAHMVAAGQFGHHPTVFSVEGDLAVDRMGAQGVDTGQRGVVHRHAGLIAGRFDTKDSHNAYYGPLEARQMHRQPI